MLKKLHSNLDGIKLYIDKKKFEVWFMEISFSYRKIITNCIIKAPRDKDGNIIWDSERLISGYNSYYDKSRNRHKNRVEYLTKLGVVLFEYWYCNLDADKISIALRFVSFEEFPELEKYINEQQMHGVVNLDTMKIDYYKFKATVISLFAINIKKAYKRIQFDESVLSDSDLISGVDLGKYSDLSDVPLKGISPELQCWINHINILNDELSNNQQVNDNFNILLSEFNKSFIDSTLNISDLIAKIKLKTPDGNSISNIESIYNVESTSNIDSTSNINSIKLDDLIKHNKDVLEKFELLKNSKCVSTKNGYVWIKDFDVPNPINISHAVSETVMFDYSGNSAIGLVYDGKNIDVLVEFIKLNFNWDIIDVFYHSVNSDIKINVTTLMTIKTEFGELKQIREILLHGKCNDYLIIYLDGRQMIIGDGNSMINGDRLEFVNRNMVYKYMTPFWGANKSSSDIDNLDEQKSNSVDIFTKACLLEFGNLSFDKLLYIKNKYGFGKNENPKQNSTVYICKYIGDDCNGDDYKTRCVSSELYFYAMYADGTKDCFEDIIKKILSKSVVNNYSNGGSEIVRSDNYIISLASSESYFIAKYERRLARHKDYYRITSKEFGNNFEIIKELKYVRYQLRACNSIKVYAILNNGNVLSDFKRYLSIENGSEISLSFNNLVNGNYLINFLDNYVYAWHHIPNFQVSPVDPYSIYQMTATEFNQFFEVDYCVEDNSK